MLQLWQFISFIRKILSENKAFVGFTISEMNSNFRKQLTMAQSLSVLKLVRTLDHARFELFSSMGFQGITRKPHICLISPSQNCTKILKNQQSMMQILPMPKF